VIAANLTTTHLTTQAFARATESGRGAAIVNIASIEASNVAPMHGHYVAAKAGVVMYTKAAARELGPHGIRVNAVSPGLIWREGLEEAWPDGVTRYQRAAPLGRLGRAEDVADACLFLSSDAARWITGVELIVDGGVLTSTAYRGPGAMTVDDMIRLLGLSPLPGEGGYYRETWRASDVLPAAALDTRYGREKPAGSAIYYLVTGAPGGFSALHRLPTTRSSTSTSAIRWSSGAFTRTDVSSASSSDTTCSAARWFRRSSRAARGRARACARAAASR
jgi:hypothetical protein